MDHYERLRRNAESKAMAEHDREQWSAGDVEFLLTFFAEAKGDSAEEREVAEALGRTIEACRQKFYDIRSGRRHVTVRTVRETSRTTTEYIGHNDDPDDQWWSPDYYQKG